MMTPWESHGTPPTRTETILSQGYYLSDLLPNDIPILPPLEYPQGKNTQKWEKNPFVVLYVWISWFVIVLMNIGAKTLATAMEVSSGGSMRPRGVKFDRIWNFGNLSQTLKRQCIFSSFSLSWYVLAVVLRSLGRSQKRRETERYCVNLENCRTKGFIMERNMCLDTEQHGLEKSKLKHFVIGNYRCALELRRWRIEPWMSLIIWKFN